jgi:hypothetical protein
LDRQKVTKKLLMPEGDFAQEAGAQTTAKVEANAQTLRFLNFTAIAARHQPSENDFSLNQPTLL